MCFFILDTGDKTKWPKIPKIWLLMYFILTLQLKHKLVVFKFQEILMMILSTISYLLLQV